MVLPVEIDVANAAQLCADLLLAVDRGHAVVVADMSDTAFCDCAGVAVLRAAAQRAAMAGAELRIVATARPVLRILQLTGLGQQVRVFRAVPAALTAGCHVAHSSDS